MFSNNSSLILLIFALIVIAYMLRPLNRNRRHGTAAIRSYIYSRDEEDLPDFPYVLQHHFLSPAELSFFQNLRLAVGNRAVICTKVGLGDIFHVKLDDSSQFRAYRNKIDRKHVDFLECDPATMRPLAGVELDDNSHSRPDRQERDEFVNGVFEHAGLPLLHLSVKRAYIVADIASQLEPFLVPVGAAASTDRVEKATTPSCPQCGNPMILRTVKRGENSGKQFWGCSTYPDCRGMLPYKQAVP